MEDNKEEGSLEPIVVTESLDPDLLEVNPKKSNKGLIVLLILLIILGIGGYIYYGKYYKNKSVTKENNPQKEEKELKKYSLEKLKTIDVNQAISYFNYDAMHKDYLEMDESNNLADKISVDSELKTVLKVDKNKLYWFKDGKWVKDETITGDIDYFISDFNIENGYKGLIAISGNKLYQFDNPDVLFDGFATEEETNEWAKKWSSNIVYKELELPGAIQNIQITYGYACEGWREYKLLIDNELYYLSTTNEGDLTLVKASEYVKLFTNLVSGCGFAPKGLRADGTINNLVNDSNDKIIVKHYIILENVIILIDKDNYLYMTNENVIASIKETILTEEDKVKDVSFKEDQSGKGNSVLEITLSDDSKLVFDEINTYHY